MSVQRYRRKPVRETDREDQFAARYEPGQSLDDLRAVARMAGDEAEAVEVAFPSGKRVLIAWFLRYDDHHPAKPDYAMVEAGEWLAYSPGQCSLYESDEKNWEQFYDLATGEGGPP
jgi:hypothetical protein